MQGNNAMSMAMKYAMQKRSKKMGDPCGEHGMPGCSMCNGGRMAEGGEVKDDGSDGIVDRIMQRFSKGGQVANETAPVADFEPNEFDELVKDGDEETSYVDDGSGSEAVAEDDKDLIGRIMRSRGKKDRLPRPA